MPSSSQELQRASSTWQVLGGAAFLAGVGAASYALGLRHARQSRGEGQETSRVAAAAIDAAGRGTSAAAADAKSLGGGTAEEASAQVGADELLRLFAQLPARPISAPDAQGAVHSSARVVLACASGKGGVGKSTISVNVAFMLRRLGLEVGLLDLDIYGPSLPELIRMPPGPLYTNAAGRVVPLTYGEVALMSWGYLNPGEAATVRAPILSQITAQLLTQVEWGALDVLVIDTPPGTGDILLSLSQTMTVDGAILVTTCNTISLADVQKGVQLFEKVSIPPLLVVANMGSFTCDSCGQQHNLFEDGAMAKLPSFLQASGIGLVRVPLDPLLSQTSQVPVHPMTREVPFVRNPDNEGREAWKCLAQVTHMVLEKLLDGGSAAEAQRGLMLKLRAGGALELRLRGGELRAVDARELRAACRCAHCIDEITGEVRIDRKAILNDPSLRATAVEPKGNYAVGITFSDGHNSLIALRAIEQMVGAGKAAERPGGERQGTW